MSSIRCPECDRELGAAAPDPMSRCPACGASLPEAVAEAEPAASAPGVITAARPGLPAGRDENSRPSAGPPRERKPARRQSSAGLGLGLVLGGAFLVLVLGGCAGVIVYWVAFRDRTIPGSEWQAFTPPDGSFTVQMPGVPVEKKAVALNGLSVTKYELRRPKEDKAFLVLSVAVNARLVRRSSLDELANAERDNMARRMQGKVTREAPVSHGGVEGREYEVRGADAVVGITRIFILEVGGRHRVFQFAVVGKSIQPDKGDAPRFLDSFRINAPPPDG